MLIMDETFIKQRLQDNDKWLARGILAIYKRQPLQEQRQDRTIENNGVGFNGVDAPFLSSLAEQLIDGKELTPKQIIYARRCMLKYAGQLFKISLGEI